MHSNPVRSTKKENILLNWLTWLRRMGGTETCRRPGLCLIGPALGPFEPVTPGAPIPGASPLCSSQCSCSRTDRRSTTMTTTCHNRQTGSGNVFPSVRASKCNSVNRYFKADIRLAKPLKDGKARASMTSRNLAIGYFIGWFLLFYSVFQRKSFTFNGSHSTLSTLFPRRFRSPGICFYERIHQWEIFRPFLISIIVFCCCCCCWRFLRLRLPESLYLKFPIASPKLTNQIGFKYFSQFRAELVAVIIVVLSDCDKIELLFQDFYRKLVLIYPFLLYSWTKQIENKLFFLTKFVMYSLGWKKNGKRKGKDEKLVKDLLEKIEKK